jgi:hypothetical protein
MKTTILTKITAAVAAATAILSLTAPANAATLKFGTDGISFNADTEIKFTFLKSKGAAISGLGVYDASGSLLKTLFQEADIADGGYSVGVDNEWLGTAKNLVGSATATYKFLAGQVYSLGLAGTLWGENMTTVFSTSSLNDNKQQAVFDSVGGKEQQEYTKQALTKTNVGLSVDPMNYPVAISFEDLKYYDQDFNDYTVEAEAVPEPITMAGMALGAGAMTIVRRRRNRKTA